MQAWIERLKYQLGPPMPAKPNDERCVIRCRRECSFLPPEVQPPMLLPSLIAQFLFEQHVPPKRQFLQSRGVVALPPQGSGPVQTMLWNDAITPGICDRRVRFRFKLHGNNFEPPMSALGQKRTLSSVRPMSALPPKADIGERDCHVRFVPEANNTHI